MYNLLLSLSYLFSLILVFFPLHRFTPPPLSLPPLSLSFHIPLPLSSLSPPLNSSSIPSLMSIHSLPPPHILHSFLLSPTGSHSLFPLSHSLFAPWTIYLYTLVILFSLPISSSLSISHSCSFPISSYPLILCPIYSSLAFLIFSTLLSSSRSLPPW